MTRPSTYAKHTGRRHKTTKRAAAEQMGLDVDVAWEINVHIEFKLWLERQRHAGVECFTLDDFRAVAMAQPRNPNAWGGFARSLLKSPLAEPAGHVRSKMPSAHRRLINQYRVKPQASA